ncbi:GDSL esterase/lipase [Melia azedarach]|uniref:GDSL esterase/lipase n=1 Tax=Melia azedarach TaxID=155640 RepID=A0ACC1X7E8_MELAZ|nr:GDSL esterase/lipase [Melia azedarach]
MDSSFSTSLFIIVIISVQYVFPLISSSSAATRQQLAPALYVFGDSLLDSGNNNLLPTIAKANYFPYGADFVKNSTGRFTNGRTVADFIAEFLGLPYSPPFMTLPEDKLPLTGLNYASGSCGILPETGLLSGICLNLGEQVGLFEGTVKLLKKQFRSSEELSIYLSKSIFIISAGSNDYMNNYLDTLLFKHYTQQEFAQLLVHKLSFHLQRLYSLGARKIIVFEIGPIGCIPSITRKYKHKGQCVEDKNRDVSLFNNMLPAMLQNLTSSLKGSIFVNGQAHWLGYDAIINPSHYGLTDASNPCCTAWFNGKSGCIPLLRPCSNPYEHYFWDGYHLTEAVYSVIASRCIYDTSVCIPFNLKKLVNK